MVRTESFANISPLPPPCTHAYVFDETPCFAYVHFKHTHHPNFTNNRRQLFMQLYGFDGKHLTSGYVCSRSMQN